MCNVPNNRHNQTKMYKKIRRYIKLNSGFTFIESIFQLFVLLILIPLIPIIFSWIYELRNDMTPENLTWEMFIYELKQYIDESDRVYLSSSNTKLNLVNNETNKITNINRYGNLIRKQVSDKGHVPLFTGITKLQFEQSDHFLTIRVELVDGEIKERTVLVESNLK